MTLLMMPRALTGQGAPRGRGLSQGASPGPAEPSAGAVAAARARRRRRSLSAPVTVIGWSGRNPARPARGDGEPPRPAPPRAPPPPLPAPTQQFLSGPGELRAAAQPVPQPLQVEPRHPLAVGVGQWVEAAQLLQVLPVAGTPAVRRNDAEEGPVGAASQSEADHDVPTVVALQEAAACEESGGRLGAGPGRAPRVAPAGTHRAAPWWRRGPLYVATR